MDDSTHHSVPSKVPPQLYIKIPELTLESGVRLCNLVVAFTFRGLLNAKGDNAVVICHALSGNASIDDWWPSLMNDSDPVINPDEHCIICCNSLGSPYGSSSPLTYREGDHRKSEVCYGPTFPQTTIRDDVRAHRYVLDTLGVKSIRCVIGPSMGGMLALEWAFYGDDYVRALVLIATAARQGAWQIAWNENQRNTIRCDAKFRDGWYGDDPPLSGLAASRMAALMTYRSHRSIEKRFGRRRMLLNGAHDPPSIPSIGVSESATQVSLANKTEVGEYGELGRVFSVQSYLRYHGDRFNARFDANCYLHILDKMDSHDITRGRCPPGLSEDEALRRVLGGLRQPSLVVGIPSDTLYPLSEQETLVENMPFALFGIIDSDEGHDGFLTDPEQLDRLVRQFFDELAIMETDKRGSPITRETDTETRKIECISRPDVDDVELGPCSTLDARVS
ncbi:acetyl coenzyme A:deacetylcephalosporin C o-acetyltransferase [Xylariomycetidae sp. FL2044]|nr:acetyl coenzyme A:deacetylcephalosporin C o-acetyltransferase [Xylariomycetidae sp. FL2044]